MRTAILLTVFAIRAAGADLLGDIEFFGYKGFDVAALRAALPVHEGDPITDSTRQRIRQAVLKATDKKATDVSFTCCDEKGRTLLFIGVAGESYKPFAYNPKPVGSERLPQEVMKLSARMDDEIGAAVRKGGDAASEDDSQGFALNKYPPLRALQMEMRQWAVAHTEETMRALASSDDVEHRRAASVALGYANQSKEQVRALVQAARDPDGDVRNNATRALGVLLSAKAKVASEVPVAPFAAMMNSGSWTDRNKSSMLLWPLSESRDAAVLAELRASAFDSLVEMASWRRANHAVSAREILGRMGQIPEDRLQRLAWDGPVQEIIDAAKKN